MKNIKGKGNPNCKGGKNISCLICGKEFWKTPLKKTRFCSAKCFGIWYSKHYTKREYLREKTLKKICPICGKEFNTFLSINQKTCSAKCAGKKNTLLSNKKNSRICKICGKKFVLSHNKTKGWYCSYKCSGIGLKRLKGGKELKCFNCGKILWKHRCRNTRFCSISCYRKKVRPSSYELFIENLLKKLKIKFVKECRFSKYYADFYLSKLKTVIEVDGGYWHNKKEIKKRDRRKTKYINSLGIKVIRIKGEDIKNGKMGKYKIFQKI